jgi:TetR/AcrR family transcriptional regulator, transcriptional repressor of bet genes
VARLAELGEIRREQICRSAAEVISERGFAGSTMRLVSERAGVSTGMLNHYFSNRAEMLLETLVFVSKRMRARCAAAVQDVPKGEERVRALVRAALPTDEEAIVTWRTWIAAYGEAVRSDALRTTIESRLEPWYDTLAYTLEDLEPRRVTSVVPLTWQFDGLLNGLAIQWLTAKPAMELTQIEETLVAFVRPTRRMRQTVA